MPYEHLAPVEPDRWYASRWPVFDLEDDTDERCSFDICFAECRAEVEVDLFVDQQDPSDTEGLYGAEAAAAPIA